MRSFCFLFLVLSVLTAGLCAQELSLLEQDTLAPAVPGKIIRYAAFLIQRHDANGDGVLQREEWKTMSGTPQSVDLDGDLQITITELVRFLALYGKNRTIHRPHVAELNASPNFDSQKLQLLKPITQQTHPPKAEGKTPDAAPIADLSEEEMKSGNEPIDDAIYEEIITGGQIPAERRFYTVPENLRRVPAWFLMRDRDGDGQVSLTEFAPTLSAAALALFGRFDKNGDGLIEPDEVRQNEK
jgi:Ca2+-binding EF-hand superfamily protein